MSTAAALVDVLDGVRRVHHFSHRCTDGNWYNPNAGQRQECPTSVAMAAAVVSVGVLTSLPRAAADDPAAARHVLWCMSGFDADALDGMDQEQREGWLTTARDAILGLASWLDSPAVTP